jgi:major vault protein
MIKGPTDYVPPVELEVVTRRKALPLDENEGIYIRDIKSGKVRAVIGETYMLNQDEELWEKDLPSDVEALLNKDALAERNVREKGSNSQVKRVKHQVVSYRVPHNGAVQIYDYKEKKSRY